MSKLNWVCFFFFHFFLVSWLVETRCGHAIVHTTNRANNSDRVTILFQKMASLKNELEAHWKPNKSLRESFRTPKPTFISAASIRRGCLTMKVHLSIIFFKNGRQPSRLCADQLLHKKKFRTEERITHYETGQHGVNTQRPRDHLFIVLSVMSSRL